MSREEKAQAQIGRTLEDIIRKEGFVYGAMYSLENGKIKEVTVLLITED